MEINENRNVTVGYLADKVNEFEKQVVQSILSLREKHILPASVQQDILFEMQLMVSHIHDTYKILFDNFCKEQNIFYQSCMGMASCITNEKSILSSVFENICSSKPIGLFLVF